MASTIKLYALFFLTWDLLDSSVKSTTCLHMIGLEKMGEAKPRDSNGKPFSLQFWLDRAGD